MQFKEKMMIFKKYWNKFLDWESEEVEFDKGWATLIVVITLATILN